jgi:hypothetical protein
VVYLPPPISHADIKLTVHAGNAPLIPAYLLSLFIQVQTTVTGAALFFTALAVKTVCLQTLSDWHMTKRLSEGKMYG